MSIVRFGVFLYLCTQMDAFTLIWIIIGVILIIAIPAAILAWWHKRQAIKNTGRYQLQDGAPCRYNESCASKHCSCDGTKTATCGQGKVTINKEQRTTNFPSGIAGQMLQLAAS